MKTIRYRLKVGRGHVELSLDLRKNAKNTGILFSKILKNLRDKGVLKIS